MTPSPTYPDGHVQLNDPMVFLHVAAKLQLSVSYTHSSISKPKVL